MNTAELKIDLIKQIATITERVKIQELLQLIQFQTDNSVYTTNTEEKTAIQEARKQINNGDILSNKCVQNEINEWLKK